MRIPIQAYLCTWLLCTVWSCLPLGVNARQPAYFILGEAEFKGLQIYDVIQDQHDNYLFSTNEGIYHYDYQRFEKIGCDVAKSNAVFYFVADRAGTVYCCNINHQIFKLQDGQCSLFYELRDDELSPDVSLAIGVSDELLVSAKKVIAISKQGAILARYTRNASFWGQPFKMQSGAVLYHAPGKDSVLIADKEGFAMRALRLAQPFVQPTSVFTLFRVDATSYMIDRETKALFRLDEETLAMQRLPDVPLFARSKSMRVYPVGNKTWIAGSLPGAVLLSGNPATHAAQLFYENYFISDIFQDHEGNILLSTFDNGVLVVPDMSIPDVIHSFRDDAVTALHVDATTGDLYMGSSKGKILRYREGRIELLRDKGMRAVESLHGDATSPYLIYDDGAIQMLDKATGRSTELSTAALKDAVVMHAQLAYLATNIGLWRCTWDAQGQPTVVRMPAFNFRMHSLERDGSSEGLIASTSLGLYQIDSSGVGKPILLDGEEIFPTAMTTVGEQVLVATPRGGILRLQAGQVTGRLQLQQLQLEILRKLVIYQNTLLAKSSHAIYQFGVVGELRKNISKVYGFPSTRVFDFVLQDSLLWVSHAGGVQAVDLTLSAAGQPQPQLRIVEIAVNDKPVAAMSAGTFPSDQRKIRFMLASPSIRHKESIRFHYRLQGYDPEWIVKPNDASGIVYNALAPGSYTFEAKAESQGQFSAVVAYSFTIARPYYAQWWFILSLVAVCVGLVILIFGWQLRLQRKKARQINELNASKLTAIQSQMNPHFIFNALNSIQDLVLKGDVENSYSYITTFSNLVRSTLNYSDKDFIDFEQEVKLLQLYLSLEQLRFKQDLEFEIMTDEIEDIQIPPLLIQPFVENALVHGLLHKAGEKRLTIAFSLQETLVCTIEDNGVGRERARAIQERQRAEHESFSGKAIRKRFDILSDVFKGEFGYHYEDLVVDGVAVGTRVTLTIPVKRQF